MNQGEILQMNESSFKPIKIPFTVKEGVTFVACLSELELLFLTKLEHNGSASCPHQDQNRFEIVDLTDLVEKGIIEIEKRIVDIFYKLTEIGKRLIDALKNQSDEIYPPFFVYE